MNYGDLKTFSRLYVPGAKAQTITNIILGKIINAGAIDVAARVKALKKFADFDIEAETGRYNLSSIANDFLVIDKGGVWWKDGSSEWIELDPTTRELLDVDYQTWRNDPSGDPQRYYTEADILELHNKPDTTLSDGGRLYYAARPETMSSDDDFPFHKDNDQKTEIPQYSILSDCIFGYVEWKVKKILSKADVDVIKAVKIAYFEEIADKVALLNRRPDILNTEDTLFRGASPC